MRYLWIFFLIPTTFLLLPACRIPKNKPGFSDDPLGRTLRKWAEKDTLARTVLSDPSYELQIIYTQIDRDDKGTPVFRSYWHGVDSTRYFYPASMVKLPLALLALEKINRLKQNGYPRMRKETPYLLDSLRLFQQRYVSDSTAPGGKPSIAHDIRQVFVVSDNLAYNHLFEFLGRDEINNSLQEKGYTRTGIVHRFNYPFRDNRYSSPITFYEPSGGIWKQGEQVSELKLKNPQQGLAKGKGYFRGDSLIARPFDMRGKNWFALTDMEKMLRAALFPQAVPTRNRFRLTESDYAFLWRYMGIYPRACDFPVYNPETYPDGYVKFFLYGDSPAKQEGKTRSFNKVGEAYGTLTDVAYIVDFEHKTEFILAATILCNKDGIFNDDAYDYEKTGYPFLARLGQQMQRFELDRKRERLPDLSRFEKALDIRQQ